MQRQTRSLKELGDKRLDAAQVVVEQLLGAIFVAKDDAVGQQSLNDFSETFALQVGARELLADHGRQIHCCLTLKSIS
ncbi:hypothetical protein D9M68_697790 [compost metagenome]